MNAPAQASFQTKVKQRNLTLRKMMPVAALLVSKLVLYLHNKGERLLF